MADLITGHEGAWAGGLGGAALGGVAGFISSPRADLKRRLRSVLLGAAAGGGIGYGLGTAADQSPTSSKPGEAKAPQSLGAKPKDLLKMNLLLAGGLGTLPFGGGSAGYGGYVAGRNDGVGAGASQALTMGLPTLGAQLGGGAVGGLLAEAITKGNPQAARLASSLTAKLFGGATSAVMADRYNTQKQASTEALRRKARNDTHTHPTDAQRHAGNYRKGRLVLHGMDIAIENPKDSVRRGISASGTKWETRMTADYGYFTSTKAVDGDAVDVFLGPDLASELVVAIDQYFGGKFDETKFILGCGSMEEAQKLYLSNYQKGWKLGPTSTATVYQLREWLREGDTKKPFSGQLVKAARSVDALLGAVRLAQRAAKLRSSSLRSSADRLVNDSPFGPGGYKQIMARIRSSPMLQTVGATPTSPLTIIAQKAQETLSKSATLRPDKWERLCDRRGVCPTCRGNIVPDIPTLPVSCTCAEKEAKVMVRRTEMVPKHNDHCPHCDHQFHEKGYPCPKLPDDPDERTRVFVSGDYDDHCPNCDGIVDPIERTDEEISELSGWLREGVISQREKRRERIATRESQAAKSESNTES